MEVSTLNCVEKRCQQLIVRVILQWNHYSRWLYVRYLFLHISFGGYLVEIEGRNVYAVSHSKVLAVFLVYELNVWKLDKVGWEKIYRALIHFLLDHI